MEPFAKINRIFTEQAYLNKHTIKITADELISVDDWLDEMHIIETAGENDLIFLDLIGYGGSFNVAAAFMDSIYRSEATIIARPGATCASAMSMIALRCDEIEVTPFTTLMLHNCSYGTYGKDKDVFDHVMFEREMNILIMNEVYQGFLSDEEISQMVDGKEFRFKGEEISERFNNMISFREAKFIEEIEAQKKAIAEAVNNNTEVDPEDPTTWYEDSKVRLKTKISDYKKGTVFEAISCIEEEGGETVAVLTHKNGNTLIVMSSDFDKLELLEESV